MALTKNDIVAKVNDMGFTKKKSIETVESCSRSSRIRLKVRRCPGFRVR